MATIRILLLALSSKNHGRCVAGINLSNGKKYDFVRLIQDNKDPALKDSISKEQTSHLKKLDIVECDVGHIWSEYPQKENMKLFGEMKKVGNGGYKDIRELCPPCCKKSNLLETMFPERVLLSEIAAGKVWKSLEMIKVSDLVFSTEQNNLGESKKKVSFFFNGKKYDRLSMTDPEFYQACEVGRSIAEAWILVSLPNEGFNGGENYYKFVSAVYPLKSTKKVFEKEVSL